MEVRGPGVPKDSVLGNTPDPDPAVALGEPRDGAEPRVLALDAFVILTGGSSSLSEDSATWIRGFSPPVYLPPRDVPELMLPAFKNGSTT